MPGSGKTLSQPENGWLAVIRLARSPVEDAVAGVDQRMADAATDVALASAGRTEDQNRGAAVEPGVATGQGHDVGLGEHGHLGELEAGERLGTIATEPLAPLIRRMWGATLIESAHPRGAGKPKTECFFMGPGYSHRRLGYSVGRPVSGTAVTTLTLLQPKGHRRYRSRRCWLQTLRPASVAKGR